MQHSAEAALVLNPTTGRITPQWNVVFDDKFATVATDPAEMPDYSHEEWSRMFKKFQRVQEGSERFNFLYNN